MKTKLLLLTLMLPLMAACSGSSTYNPKFPYPGEDPEVKEKQLHVYFYLDNQHTDTPLYEMEWYILEPLGECPAEAKLTDADAADPLYPHFIGYSEYSSSIDEDHIWDFEKDYKQDLELCLYGIWVSEQEVMMMNKKLFRRLLLLVPTVLLSACNFKYTYNIAGLVINGMDFDDGDDIEDSGSYDIKIWVDQKIVSLTQSQIGQFVANSGGKYQINATIEPVSEDKAAASMLQDVQDGADIFVFAQDQLARLKLSGALAKLSSNYVSALESEMGEDAVNAAKVNDDVYAFPITADNGYFLYYDKNYVSDEEAGNMTTLLAACQRAGKTLNFEARSNGFYAASYFMAAGLDCYSKWHINEKTGKFDSYEDTYNTAAGLEAAKGLKELDNKALVATNSQASKLGSSSAAVVSGIWEYEVAEKNLGEDRLGCAPLPTFTVGDASYQLSSFDGYKLLGVKPQQNPKRASVCRKIARFLTGEDCQNQRFEQASWGPTNQAAAQTESVLNHKGLAALMKQHEYAKPQGQCPGSWFVALATTAKAITASATDDQLRLILKNYENGLAELLDSD